MQITASDTEESWVASQVGSQLARK